MTESDTDFKSERDMESQLIALLRDRGASKQAFGERLKFVGHQMPIARTVYLDEAEPRPRRSDVMCVDRAGRLVICELKIVLDEKLLLQGLAYARLVQRNLPAWEEALEQQLDSRVRLWLFNWGLHDSWLDLIRPLAGAYAGWLADLRYYGSWQEDGKQHMQVQRIDDLTRTEAISKELSTRTVLATADEIRSSLPDNG